jgi:hypothetical protein
MKQIKYRRSARLLGIYPTHLTDQEREVGERVLLGLQILGEVLIIRNNMNASTVALLSSLNLAEELISENKYGRLAAQVGLFAFLFKNMGLSWGESFFKR